MSTLVLFPVAGIGLFCIGLYSLLVQAHLLRKLLAINIMGSGVFLTLVSLGLVHDHASFDPLPHAMVITGIVVAVSATSLGLVLLLKIAAKTGRTVLSDTSGEA